MKHFHGIWNKKLTCCSKRMRMRIQNVVLESHGRFDKTMSSESYGILFAQ